MTRSDFRYHTVGLAVVCLVALLTGAATPTAAAPYCNKATSIAETADDHRVVTTWDRARVYDADWQETRDVAIPNQTFGVARGPDGSLWTLEQTTREARVVRRNNALEAEAAITLENGTIGDDWEAVDRDLAFDGRWLVLSDGAVTAYDADWSDRDTSPSVQRHVPDGATGLAVTDETLAFVTANGTINVYGATAAGYEHESRFSVDLNDTAVDVHPGANDTWLVLQPGNLTVVRDDGEVLDRPASFAAPAGCSASGGVVIWPLFAMMGVVLVVAVLVGVGLLLFVGLLAFALYQR